LADRLHEHVAQTLSAARFYLGSVGGDCEASERDAIQTVERIVGRAIAECRSIAQELSPPSLDEYGLGPALEALAQRVMRQTGTSIEVDADKGGPDLEREALLAMFHVLAEVVEGAAADADEQSVRIHSRLDESALSVSVSYRSRSPLDLFGACERMGRVGGSLLSSEDERGTVVTVRTPWLAA
jgi:signal transduction histidine kinase